MATEIHPKEEITEAPVVPQQIIVQMPQQTAPEPTEGLNIAPKGGKFIVDGKPVDAYGQPAK